MVQLDRLIQRNLKNKRLRGAAVSKYLGVVIRIMEFKSDCKLLLKIVKTARDKLVGMAKANNGIT